MKTQGLYKGERFSTDISVSVAQIEKFQKARWLYFLILLLGGPSPPSQLVPNPFNWSPNNVFLQISLYRSLKSQKFKKQGGFIFEFCLSLGFSYGLITAVICGNWIFVLRSANEVNLPRKICCITTSAALLPATLKTNICFNKNDKPSSPHPP